MDTSKAYIKEEEMSRTMSLTQFLGRMWPYLVKRPYRLGLVVGVVVFYVCVGRMLPLLFGYAIDEGIKKQQLQIIFWVAGTYLFLELTRSTLAFFQNFWMQKLGNATLFDLRESLISHVQKLPNTFFDKTPVGRTVTRITNDMAALGELFSQAFTAIFVNTFEIISIFFALCFISFKLTFLTLLVAPLILWASYKISQKLRFVSQKAKKVMSSINSYTAESLNGMKVLQLFNKTFPRRKHFHSLSHEYKQHMLQTIRLYATLWPLLECFSIGTVATALFFGAFFRGDLGLTVGELSAFILLLQSFFGPFRVILERYSQMQNSLASADRVFAMMDEKEESSPEQDFSKPIRGLVEFSKLSFRYDTEAPIVLKDLNLKIYPGESVALVGRTGSGKTSIVSLLQKMYDYKDGKISIDGQPIHEISNRALRSRIGVVQQENFIFKGSVASNIRLENPLISDKQVLKAAEQTGCLEILNRRRGGLEAKVEEGGANLSVGERQLIAFARVLAFDPDIFILDEATASIDSESEQKIQYATEIITKNRTSIIIAHRLSTIKNCDRIVILSNGEILEQGSHQELLSRGGPYFELYNSQFEHTVTNQPLDHQDPEPHLN